MEQPTALFYLKSGDDAMIVYEALVSGIERATKNLHGVLEGGDLKTNNENHCKAQYALAVIGASYGIVVKVRTPSYPPTHRTTETVTKTHNTSQDCYRSGHSLPVLEYARLPRLCRRSM